jgi:hypothetical protein
MQLTEQIAARVDPNLKKKLNAEVLRRRLRGEGVAPADVIRDALIRYFETHPELVTKDAKGN